MPVYEYECQSCTEITEIWQGINDAPLAICPCCSGPMKKIISMSSFALKGGGWYADGYSQSAAPDKSAASDKSATSATAPTSTCGKNEKTSSDSC